MSQKTNPLITLALIAYNQENFVEEAIGGALSQTYSPLEIIFSDDGSTDSTFEIMQRAAERYRGPHQIILNRNCPNQKIARHLNRVFSLAKGELVVIAAADDVALPHRVQATFEAWDTFNRTASCIYSGYTVIGNSGENLFGTAMEYHYGLNGKTVEEILSPMDFFGDDQPWIFGCAAAYSPSLLHVFGPLPDDLTHEDDVLLLRAACLGPTIRINSSLVRYRIHGGNASGRLESSPVTLEKMEQKEAQRIKDLKLRLVMQKAFAGDIETALRKNLVADEVGQSALEACRLKQRILAVSTNFPAVSNLQRVRYFLELKRLGIPYLQLRQFFFQLFPSKVVNWLKVWRNRFRKSKNN